MKEIFQESYVGFVGTLDESLLQMIRLTGLNPVECSSAGSSSQKEKLLEKQHIDFFLDADTLSTSYPEESRLTLPLLLWLLDSMCPRGSLEFSTRLFTWFERHSLYSHLVLLDDFPEEGPELVTFFLTHLQKRVLLLYECFEQQQWGEMKEIIHKLKSSGAYGFTHIADCAKAVEHRLKKCDYSSSLDLELALLHNCAMAAWIDKSLYEKQ